MRSLSLMCWPPKHSAQLLRLGPGRWRQLRIADDDEHERARTRAREVAGTTACPTSSKALVASRSALQVGSAGLRAP
eukprot:2713931-Prymnesium_polylepis.1